MAGSLDAGQRGWPDGASAGNVLPPAKSLPVGVGAEPRIPGTGTGIVGLAERASLAGGQLEHGFTPAGDYRLWVWLPWPA